MDTTSTTAHRRQESPLRHTTTRTIPIETTTTKQATSTPHHGDPMTDILHKATGGAYTTGGVGGKTHEEKQIEQSMKEGAHEAKRMGEKALGKVSEVSRSYPKLMTATLLIIFFLIGATCAGIGSKLFGGSRTHFLSSHWDRETADAHHALDVVIDHLKHPELYQTAKSESYVTRARHSLKDIFEGILPGGMMGRKKSMPYGRDAYEGAREKGRDYYEGARERVSDLSEDLSHRARRGMEGAKDVGYGLTSKLGNMAESVKHAFVGEEDSGATAWMKEPMKERGGGGWFGGKTKGGVVGGYGEEDEEFEVAADKLKHVMRTAERRQH